MLVPYPLSGAPMIRKALLLPVLAASLAAQVPASKWSFGFHQYSPTFEGHVTDFKDASNNWDLVKDFGIGKDGSTPGAFLSYDGPRFGFSLSMDGQKYVGDKILSREVTVDNTKFRVNTQLKSKIDLQAMDLCWTIRVYRWEQAWLGVDLGAQAWDLKVAADGTTTVNNQTTHGHGEEKQAVPIPQFGLSVGGHFLEERAVVKASVHILSYKGAKYTRTTADARFFVLPWLGLRAYVDNHAFDAPRNSVDENKEIKLDRMGAGFGIVARW